MGARRSSPPDPGGREKQPLIDRIVGRELTLSPSTNGSATQASAGRASASSASSAPASSAAAIDLDPSAKLTCEQLEGYLWAAADILRGSIDSSDYKGFIFGLLFLKRLSDRFEEECEQLVAEGADPEDPDEHPFFVPKIARWSSIQRAATGLGELLNKASTALEEANSQALEGVLAGIERRSDLRKRRTDDVDAAHERIAPSLAWYSDDGSAGPVRGIPRLFGPHRG